MTSAASTMASLLSILLFCSLSDINWTIHSAHAERVGLPIQLQAVIVTKRMRMHFCGSISIEQCPTSLSDMSICSNLCNSDPSFHTTCPNTTGSSMCLKDDQHPYCEYQDAIVCQYNDMTGSCIHSNSSSVSSFCVCKNQNGLWPATEEELFPIKKSCKDNVSGTTGSTASPVPSTSMYEFTNPIASNPRSTSFNPTTTTASLGRSDDHVNIIAIVLGITLALVLLVLILVCFLKRNRQPSKTTTTNISLDAEVADISQLPEPLVLGNTEYPHAYDHLASRTLAPDTGEPEPVNHTGRNRYEADVFGGPSSTATGNSTEAPEGPKYYEIGQARDDGKGGNTPKVPQYYELEAAERSTTPQGPNLYDEVKTRRDATIQEIDMTPENPHYFLIEKTHTDKEFPTQVDDESANSSPEGISNQGYDQTYTPLVPTTESSDIVYEPLQTSSSTSERNDTSSPYDNLKTNASKPNKDRRLPDNEGDSHQYASING